MIGAGLKALEKNSDSAAVKHLFHMFAVTQDYGECALSHRHGVLHATQIVAAAAFV